MPDTLRLAGALVSPHSHDDLRVAVHESGAQITSAVDVLDFGVGFDVTEGPAGEANIALDLTEAVWTFAQGGFRFRDASGPLLYTGGSGDDLFLTGDLDVSGVAAVGNQAAIDAAAREALRVQHQTGNVTIFAHGAGAFVKAVVNTATAGYGFGLTGEAEYTGSAAGSYLLGLGFNVIQNGAGGLSWLHGVRVGLVTYAGKGAVSQSKGLSVWPDYQGPKPTTFWGLHIEGHTGMNTVYGVKVDDFTGATIYLLEMGPATPYLRLVGGANPGANQTNLYLAEGSTPTLRRVQWKAGNTLGAGDRVLVLA